METPATPDLGEPHLRARLPQSIPHPIEEPIPAAQVSPTERQRWLYSIANLGNAIPYQMINFLLFFYVDIKGLPVPMASIVMVAYAIWDSINNPVMGYLSDNTQSRWGRRIPYMLFGVVPYAVFFVLIWLPPFEGVTQPYLLLAYLVGITFAWEALGTIMATAYFSLLPEMFRTYHDRIKVAVSMNMMQVIGLLVGLALTPWLANQVGWPQTALAYALVVVVAYFFGLTGMFERPQPAAAKPMPLLNGLRLTLMNPAFLTASISQTFRFVSGNVLTTGVMFYVVHSLGRPESFGSVVMGAAFVVTALALRPWRIFIAARFDARKTLMIANAVMAVAIIPMGFATSTPIILLGAAGVGLGLAGLILMGDVIMADVVDEDHVRTGLRREGVYYGLSKLIMKMSTSIAAVIFTWVTAAYGYIPGAAAQAESVGLGFRVYISVPVVVCSLLAVAALYFYPLHGARLQAVKDALVHQGQQSYASEPPIGERA